MKERKKTVRDIAFYRHESPFGRNSCLSADWEFAYKIVVSSKNWEKDLELDFLII